jgi:hypothetical protein
VLRLCFQSAELLQRLLLSAHSHNHRVPDLCLVGRWILIFVINYQINERMEDKYEVHMFFFNLGNLRQAEKMMEEENLLPTSSNKDKKESKIHKKSKKEKKEKSDLSRTKVGLWNKDNPLIGRCCGTSSLFLAKKRIRT